MYKQKPLQAVSQLPAMIQYGAHIVQLQKAPANFTALYEGIDYATPLRAEQDTLYGQR